MNKGIGAAFRAKWMRGMKRPTRYPCRCTACGQRRNLRMHPDEYRRAPRCRSSCKGSLRVDWYRMAAEWNTTPCKCLEYSFPHARGRGYCQHNARCTVDQRQEREETGRWA